MVVVEGEEEAQRHADEVTCHKIRHDSHFLLARSAEFGVENLGFEDWGLGCMYV